MKSKFLTPAVITGTNKTGFSIIKTMEIRKNPVINVGKPVLMKLTSCYLHKKVYSISFIKSFYEKDNGCCQQHPILN